MMDDPPPPEVDGSIIILVCLHTQLDLVARCMSQSRRKLYTTSDHHGVTLQTHLYYDCSWTRHFWEIFNPLSYRGSPPLPPPPLPMSSFLLAHSLPLVCFGCELELPSLDFNVCLFTNPLTEILCIGSINRSAFVFAEMIVALFSSLHSLFPWHTVWFSFVLDAESANFLSCVGRESNAVVNLQDIINEYQDYLW